MSNLAIPAILATTVSLAGMLALIPIEKAGTVHSGLQVFINDLTTLTAATIADDGNVIVVTTEPKLINGRVVALAVPASADLTFNLQSDDDFDATFAEAGELNQASTGAGVIDIAFTNRGALRLIDVADGDANAVDIDNDQIILLIERFA